ncbi:MAG: site-2 protease family protein [Clostridia bacterium]|nr:site-2 protease family protein [Clostridia bacterium]
MKIRIHPLLPLLLALGWVTKTLPHMLGMYLCLLLHEAGHLTAALLLRMGVSYLGILPLGIAIRLKEEHTRPMGQRILVAAAGPAASFLGAAAALIEKKWLGEQAFFFFFCANFCLGLFNLLPISSFDGGRILFYLISDAFGSIIGYHRVVVLSGICVCALAVLGGAVLYTTGWNPSLLMISCFFGYKMWAESGYERLTMTQNAMDYRQKKRPDGIFKTRTLTVKEQVPLRRLLKYFSSGRYCVVHIVDKDMRLKTTLTEQQIADALVQNGGTLTGENYDGSTTQASAKALPVHRRGMGQHPKGSV